MHPSKKLIIDTHACKRKTYQNMTRIICHSIWRWKTKFELDYLRSNKKYKNSLFRSVNFWELNALYQISVEIFGIVFSGKNNDRFSICRNSLIWTLHDQTRSQLSGLNQKINLNNHCPQFPLERKKGSYWSTLSTSLFIYALDI
jgi:hypothetical protein